MFKSRRKLLGEVLPFEDHITGDIVLMKTKAVMAMFAVDGVCPDAADVADIVSWFDTLHNALKSIAAEDIEVNVYTSRAEVDGGISIAKQLDGFPAELCNAYEAQLLEATLYAVPLSVAIQIHPPNIAARGVTKLVGDPNIDAQGSIDDRAERLTEVCNRFQAQLAPYGLRRLGYDDQRAPPAIFDEIAETLVFAVTGVWRPIAATTGQMGNAMFSEDVRFGGHLRWRKHIQFDGPGRSYYASMFAFREYPLATWPGILQPLLNAPYKCTIAQSFRFLSNAAGEGIVTRRQNKRLIAGDRAHNQTAKLNHAAEQILNREWVLGDHSFTFIAFADRLSALDNVSHAAWRDLAACGITAVRMTGTLRASWLSMLPGGAQIQKRDLRPRPGFVSSRNFCAFSPFYSWPKGEEEGHWPGGPIAIFRTLGGTPYRFHWHVGTVGNTLVTGMTGSGKTTLVAFLIAMTAGRARIIGLDHKRGWQFLAHRLGADYAIAGRGEPLFAPLKMLEPTPHNIEFLIDLVRSCVGGRMTEEEGRRNALGIRTIMTKLPPEKRSLGEHRAFFDNDPEGAGARLEKWIWPTGELGWVIDAPAQAIRFGQRSFMDTTWLLANERARGPALACAFHYISLMLDGTPTLIPCDETWRAFGDADFFALLEEKARTIRSKNGAMVFITQSPDEFAKRGKIILEQCQSQFHLANRFATEEDYIEGFKFTKGQYEAFRGLPSGQGYFLLKQEDKSLVAQAPMRGMDEHLRILSASERELNVDDQQEMLEAAE